MGEDVPLLGRLAYRNGKDIPTYAILVQSVITLRFIYTAIFQQVLLYAGFTLNLITTITVAGVFLLRRQEPGMERPYRTWGYPWPPVIFLIFSVWSLTYMLIEKPWESLAGLVTMSVGLVSYFTDIVRAKWLAKTN